MLITAFVGFFLASPFLHIHWLLAIYSMLGISFMAGSGAVFNHVIDWRIDQKMQRTHKRPVAAGRVPIPQALVFACVLSISGFVVLWVFVNPLTAWLTLLTTAGYAFIYTIYLKPFTPQNIVIGGLSGAMPPLLGWTSVTGSLHPLPLLLVLLVFVWTPPHFWALAIARFDDYKKNPFPMFPIVYGIPLTRLHIFLYSLVLFLVGLLIGYLYFSYFYFVNLLLATILWFYYTYKIMMKKPNSEIQLFWYSIVYLFWLFLAMMLDFIFLSWGWL